MRECITAKLTCRNQTTIPVSYRDYLELNPGDHLKFSLNDQGEVVVTKATKEECRETRGRRKRKDIHA